MYNIGPTGLLDYKRIRDNYLNGAMQAAADGDQAKQVRDLYHAILMDNRRVELYVYMVDVLIDMKKYTEAFIFAQILSRTFSPETGQLLCAKIYLAQKNLSGAKETLERALQINPGNVTTRLELAQVYLALGEYELSELKFGECQLSTDQSLHFKSSFFLAIIQLLFKNFASAIDSFKRLASLKNEIPHLINYHMALAFAMKENYAEALKCCELGLNKHPNRLG